MLSIRLRSLCGQHAKKQIRLTGSEQDGAIVRPEPEGTVPITLHQGTHHPGSDQESKRIRLSAAILQSKTPVQAVIAQRY